MDNKIYFTNIVKLIKPYMKHIVSVSLLLFVTMVLNLFLPIVQKKIIDDAIMKRNIRLLMYLIFLTCFLCILIALVSYICSIIQLHINFNLNERLQLQAIEHAFRLKYKYIQDQGIFKICKDADICIENICQLTDGTIFSLILQIFQFVGIIVSLLIINWKLTLLGFLILPCRAMISTFISKKMGQYSDENIRNHQKLHKWEDDAFTSVYDIKLWNIYSKKTCEYKKLLRNRNKNVEKMERLNSLDQLLGMALNNISYNFIYFVAALLIWKENITLGGLLVFTTYFNYLLEPINLFSTLSIMLADVKPSIENWKDFMELEEEGSASKGAIIDNLERPLCIEFENISYSYGKRMIFENVNLSFNEGENIAIVGENGSGKTTFINLLLAFLKPDTGTIKLNGKDVFSIDIDSYREVFGVVMQNPTLFDASILDNLSLFGKNVLPQNITGLPLLDFINKLQEKSQSRVGNKSGYLSGGEKQKIAFMRTIFAKKKILILDEPTSNYDKNSEEIFNSILLDKNNSAISIVITHNPEIIEKMDRVICIKDQGIKIYNKTADYFSECVYN